MSLNNAIALVAGASGGIGRAISIELLRAGADVFMVGRNKAGLAQSTVRGHLRNKQHCVVADLNAEGTAERIAAEISPRGRLDVLILSSGMYERSHDQSVFVNQIATNLVGPYVLTQKLLPMLIKAKGQIVFINSTQGLRAAAGVGQYAATKHALRAVADSLRDEINPDGVRVTSIFLGRTATEMQRSIFVGEGREYAPEKLIQPADIAALVVFLMELPRTSEVTDIVLRPMQKT